MENFVSILSTEACECNHLIEFPHDEVRILTGVERVFEALIGCRHQWGFPQTTDEMQEHYRVVGFDSHQTCTQCGRQRFFNFKLVEAGPMFQKRAQL